MRAYTDQVQFVSFDPVYQEPVRPYVRLPIPFPDLLAMDDHVAVRLAALADQCGQHRPQPRQVFPLFLGSFYVAFELRGSNRGQHSDAQIPKQVFGLAKTLAFAFV